jgi:branched-subunit amino acid transport protein
MNEVGFWTAAGVLAVGAAVTYFWRFLGVLLSGRIDPQSRLFEWVGAVAYALLAALIARMIVLPLGPPLTETPLLYRLTATFLALVVFFLTRRNILLGVLGGVLVLVALTLAAPLP